MAQSVSIKKNFLYSGFITAAKYIFTFITYPYVSRVLGVDRVGTVNFVDSVINYFMMLSMMGIVIVGIREIAKSKSDRRELDRTFSSIFFINMGLTAIALVILGVAYLCVPKLHAEPHLMAIGVAKLLSNIFLMDWFFKGMEDFRIITIRTFIVRSLYVGATFIFIQDEDDYIIYFLLTALASAANAFVNYLYMRRFVRLRPQGVQIKRYLIPILILGLYMFFGNFYSSFNTMVLGIQWNDTEVGYFTTATKLFAIILAMFSAFTSVMMPRMSVLLKEGRMAEYHDLFRKSVNIVLTFCLPMVLLCVVQADNVVLFISGSGYEGAVLPMRICMPLMVVIAYTQIMLNQCLMPMSRDRAILLTTVVGGLLALCLCFVLIPLYGCEGSAILWVCSEVAVCAVASYYVHRFTGIGFPLRRFACAAAYHIPLFCLLYVSRHVATKPFVNIVASGILTFAYCFVLQCLVLKDRTIRGIFRLNNSKP